MKKFLIYSLVIMAGVFVPFISAHALTISPARLEINGDPGQTISGTFLLINEQEDTKTFYSSAENFEAQGDTGTPSFVEAKEGLATWVNVASEVTLKKGEQQKIPFTITIPKDADAGGHFAAIFLSTSPVVKGSGQVSVGAKVGVLVLLRVSGDIKEGGGITNFTTSDKSSFYSTLPINFAYRFSNTGNDRVRPDGNLVIRNTVGFTTLQIPANESKGNVLPGSVRRFEILWGSDKPLIANAGFFASAQYEWTHFAFGWYRASLDLTYGSASAANSRLNLFVFPWQLSIIFLVLLTIVGFAATKGLKSYNRWIINKARNMQ